MIIENIDIYTTVNVYIVYKFVDTLLQNYIITLLHTIKYVTYINIQF